VDTLRAAGLVVDEMTTAKWQAELHADERRELLVLFDSRMAASRDNAAAFQQGGCPTLDVAALLRSHRSDDTTDSPPHTPAPRRLRVLERAKQQIEAAGFLWARVADFPYPFQAALVDDRGGGASRDDATRRTILLPAAARGWPPAEIGSRRESGDSLLGRVDVDDLYAQYVAGQALYVSPGVSASDALILDSALESGMFPLLWRTNAAEFGHWRRLRRSFAFRIDERHRRYEIRYEQLPVHFRPAIELWRGGHFAVVPLQRSRQQIDAGQIVYQSAGRRHPAGIAAMHANLESHAKLLTAASRVS
jgi:hypothetical protein